VVTVSMHGADVQELRRLSAELTTAADELDNEGQLMTRMLNNVSWLGDVATRFLGNWTDQQLPRIGLSTRFLREAAEQLTRHADEQERASSAGTSGTISPKPVPHFRTTAVGEDGTRPPDMVRTMEHGYGEDGNEPIFDRDDRRTVQPIARTASVGEDGTQPPDVLHRTMAVGEDGTQPPDMVRTMEHGYGEDGNEPIFDRDDPRFRAREARTMMVGEDGTQPHDET
jgi:hypothetical protein